MLSALFLAALTNSGGAALRHVARQLLRSARVARVALLGDAWAEVHSRVLNTDTPRADVAADAGGSNLARAAVAVIVADARRRCACSNVYPAAGSPR
jgi:hypothetical protein